MRPAASWLAVPAFAVAIAAERAAGLDATASVADAAAGLALLGGAATLAGARGGRRSAALMALTSLTWLAGDFWPALLFAHRGPLVHLLLGYPRGRVASRAAGAVVAAAYVDGLIPALARKDTATVVLAAGVLAVAVLQQRRTGGPERRARLAALGATALLAAVVAGAAIARAASWDADRAFLLLYDAAVVVIAVTLAADLRWGRWTRAAVTGLVVDLGRLERPGSLGTRLGRAVGDPGLVIAYPVADRHVDDQGRPVVLPEPGSDRAVTPVLDGHERVATLIHDAALLDDPELAQAAVGAARLALGGARMEADLRLRIREVEASRRRLLDAGDAQRRGLHEAVGAVAERCLADAAQCLDEAAAGDQGRAEAIADLRERLDLARADLHRFAQGLHPRELTDAGLGEALQSLAERSAVPVHVSGPGRVLPAPVEVALYFVCAEALTNVAKYARATGVAVRVAHDDGHVSLSVVDDGCGGADPARGSGLRGVADRVDALGGRLRVHSPAGGGTRIVARLPLGGGGPP